MRKNVAVWTGETDSHKTKVRTAAGRFSAVMRSADFWRGEGLLLLLVLAVSAAGVLIQHVLDIRLQAEGISGWSMYIPVGIAVMLVLNQAGLSLPAKRPAMVYGVALLNCIILMLFFYYASAGYSGYFEMYYLTIAIIPLYAGAVFSFKDKGMKGVACCSMLLAAGLVPCAVTFALRHNSALPGAALIFLLTGAFIVSDAIYRGHFGKGRKKQFFLFWGSGICAAALAWAAGLFHWITWRESLITRTEMVRAFIGNIGFARGLFPADMEQADGLFYPAALDNFITHLMMKYGAWSGLAAALLFAVFVYFMLRLINGQPDPGRRMVGMSIAAAFAVSAILYTGTNLGAFSLYGIILPFISWGKIGFFLSAALMGIFLNCCRRQNPEPATLAFGISVGAGGPLKVKGLQTEELRTAGHQAAEIQAAEIQAAAHKSAELQGAKCRPIPVREAFLAAVCDQIRCEKAHPLVKEELESHIDDQLEANLKHGMALSEAEEEAVKEMGDPEEIGQLLDHTHKPKPEWRVIALAACITLLSGFLQWIMNIEQSSLVIDNWLLYAPLGFAVMAQIYFLDVMRLCRRPAAVYLLITAADCLLLIFLRYTPLQVYWYKEGISVYQLYIVLLSIPFFAAAVYQYRDRGTKGVAACAALLLVGMYPSFTAPSLIGAVILGISGAALMTAAILKGHFGVKKKRCLASFWGITAGAAAAFCGLTALLLPYRFQRLIEAFFPLAAGDPLGSGYMPSKLFELLSGSAFFHGMKGSIYSGVWRQINENRQFSNYYLLNFITIKYGIFISLLVIAAFIVFLICLIKAVRKQKNTLSWLLCASVVCAFGTSGFVYGLNNTGLVSFSAGILPFLSADVTGYLICCALLGVFLSAGKGNSYIRDRDLDRDLNWGLNRDLNLHLDRDMERGPGESRSGEGRSGEDGRRQWPCGGLKLRFLGYQLNMQIERRAEAVVNTEGRTHDENR